MRAGRVRIVLGLSRRRVGVRVPGARWTGQRPRDRDRRGHRARGLAASRAKGIRRGGRGAVRFLHARPHRRDARPAAAGASAERRSDPRGAGRQHLPLHRLREDHRRGSACGGAHAMSETPHPTLPGERGGKKPRLAPPARTTGRVGESVPRPDGALKVRGDFPYSSDLQVEGMIWGATLRSPHPYARIISIDTTEAHSMPGVHAVLTHHDVPGRNVYGLEIQDQPVLAFEVVRYWGEAVALVAADHPEQARRAAEKVHVEYEVLPPVTKAERALSPDAPSLHPGGNVTRWVKIRHGEAMPRADVVVRGEYEIGMQDQAPLGPESGLAVPDGEGGVDLYIATQWLHVDQKQLADVLGLAPEKVRLTMAGIGGAFGAREDLSMQAHACMLALKTGRPVKISYSRPESFVGHVHRHPGRLTYEHGANRDGKLVYVNARILLDGGAYASSSTAVIANASCFAVGPYQCPNATIDGIVAYSNNPPCGAMRGFGSVQNCYAHEAQMDKLAAALGMDPVELRIRNAMKTGSRLITGQAVDGPVPVAELLRRVAAMPLPPAVRTDELDLTLMPGGVSNTTHGESGAVVITLATLLGEEAIEETREFRPRITSRLDPETGQANAHMQYAFAAHRAVVDVDTELGLVKVVELATAQDVGKAINPQAVEGQLEGGAAQGLGLAVMEEVQVVGGVIRNPSFTDYLLPTTLDMPPVRMDILELGDPNSPYGLKGVGEPPAISSGPAIVAAIRSASGRALSRVPVRPHDLTL